MLRYRLQWPFLTEDCYECGKGLHFRSLFRRIYKPGELDSATKYIIDQARTVMEWDSPVFSRDGLVNIQDGNVITVPKVGNFTASDWGATTDGT